MSDVSSNDKANLFEPARQKGGLFRRFRKKPSSRSASLHEKAKADAEDTAVEREIAPVPFMQMFRFSKPQELLLDFVGLLAAAIAGAAQPSMSLFFGRLTQDYVTFGTVTRLADAGNSTAQALVPEAAARFRHGAALNASYLTYLGLGMFVCTFLYMYIWVYTGEVNAKRVREGYLRAVLRQDITFFDKVGAGEVATRIQTDCHLVQQGISEKVPLVVNCIASFVTGFVVAYIRSWRLALALSSVLPCIAVAGSLMNKSISTYMQLALKHTAHGGTLAEEVISTVRTAQAFGTQNIFSDLYTQHLHQALSVNLKAALWQGGVSAVFSFVIFGAYALTFYFGTTLINSGHATAGTVVNVYFAITTGAFALVQLTPHIQTIMHARGAASKLFATIDRVPNIDSSSTEGLKPESVEGEIVLEDVKFSYPSRPDIPVVKSINLRFAPGKTSALVGASGSGKSTVISLIERFYDPLSGVVKLDGCNIKDLNIQWLRSHVGLVSQEPTLFATTVKENVTHGLINTRYENASEEEKFARIKEACVKANAHGFISELPAGYDTMVGERGFLLSGGQKQRIAIARAIVSDPRILLLDEATSALDTQSEGIVQDALDKAAQGRTTITIAHRLSTIKDADIIYVMGDGLLLESGTHEELLRDETGAYSRLVAAQKLRETEKQKELSREDSHEDIEQAARAEVSRSRRNTRQSFASDILEQKQERQGDTEEEDYGIFYVLKRMGILNRDQWKRYVFGFIFAGMAGMVYPALGIVFSLGIEGFSSSDPHERRRLGDRNALWFFIFAIVSTIAVTFQNYLFAAASSQLSFKIRKLSFKAMLRQDIEFFDRVQNSTGTLVSSLGGNAQKVSGLAGITFGAIVQSIISMIAGAVIGLIFIWKLALVAIACMPLLMSGGYIRLRVVVLKDQANRKAHEESARLACEAAGAIRAVASLTRERDCLNQYSMRLEEAFKKSNRRAFWGDLIYSFSQSMVFFVIALVFWYGSRLVSTREFGTFEFFVGFMSCTFSAIQAGNVFSYVPDISQATGAGSNFIKLIDSIPEIDAESPEGEKIEKAEGHIRIENVDFRYPTRSGVCVLRKLNLTVKPGEYVALVGASGSGKSTIIQLLERFYDPSAGDIYLDGQNIKELNIESYRRQIALVSQEPTLYAGTIKFNILLGANKPSSEVTQEEIEAACRNANILDFIKSLPDAFETEVGGKGSQLSGGQKQRISIARALLRNPKVLLLDEATSALDSNSEKVVQEALDRAAKGRTTIAIAHRLSTIQNADRIYFIKDGQVEECGTHDELVAKKGAYAEYVALQQFRKAE
ncbi:putative P-loop containing nucleoside triphosphate hydrolase protein [Lyophyllum shimeji]|uniref:P-loop containing nucleoside triphosphate hydrolase protein n=1 Tax=Lyophyllum shimeji TaxID=47721 RepID=A0A9P3PQZ0_LYOSH|nr:putative P-loop containing nucleoside triphosphate hydrolase protein [Lyophyllum shimeji]